MNTFHEKEMTPRHITKELDKHIIGQTAGKRAVAIALRNRWRRQQADPKIREEIKPKNIILIGPTGCGKTEIARRLAKLVKAPFSKIEATKYTEVGYVGKDVESIIRDLVDVAITMVKEEAQTRVMQKARNIAIERILDILLPPNVSPQEAESNLPLTPEELAEGGASIREKMKSLIEDGKLANRMITIELQSASEFSGIEFFGASSLEEMQINIREMLKNLGPRRKKRKKVTISDALDVLAKDEAAKLVDIEAVTKEALDRAENHGIVFIDEFDKICGHENLRGAGVSREGVQRDLLPIVEGCTIQTKYGFIRTDHILFIASGAFHSSKPSDLMPELQGRFPIRVELKSLTKNDFYDILTKTEASLLTQYTELLKSESLHIRFEDNAIWELCNIAVRINEQHENIGARRLYTVLEALLEEISFHAPDMDIKDFLIDKDYVLSKLAPILQDQDLSKYIL